MSFAIDIAWDRPSTASIKASGASGVLRYLSTDPSKNLTAAEVHDYASAGLGVGTVWETTATRATQGYQAGIDDASLADGQRKSLGLPSDHIIFFAVDTDTSWASAADYARGFSAVIGQSRVGVYGGLDVIDGAHGAGYRYLWQTLAWSRGVRSKWACLYQNGNTLFSGGADVNDILASDWGQFPRPAAPKPPAPKPPAPTLLEESVLAYLPPILPNVDVDLPVEPAGTVAKPQGGANNGPLWLCLQAQGVAAKVTLTLHQGGKLGAPISATLAAGGAKGVFSLPTDGSVDFVRITSTAPLIGYLTGRQVA